MSTHRPRPTSRRAPLAARESLESRMEDFTELREFTRAGGHHEKPRDLKLKPQNLTQQEFYEMSRKQQNLKMYKAIYPVVVQMFSEWHTLTSTLRSLERRIEILQLHQDLEDRERSLVAVSTVGGDLPVRHYYRHEYDAVDGCILSSNRGQGSQVSAHFFSKRHFKTIFQYFGNLIFNKGQDVLHLPGLQPK